jgi:Tol biopolymer transport system component
MQAGGHRAWRGLVLVGVATLVIAACDPGYSIWARNESSQPVIVLAGGSDTGYQVPAGKTGLVIFSLGVFQGPIEVADATCRTVKIIETSSQAILVTIDPAGQVRLDDVPRDEGSSLAEATQLTETQACLSRVQAAPPASGLGGSSGPQSADDAVIYFSGGPDHDIWIVHADGSQLTDLTPGSKWDQVSDGSPDAKRIAFDRLGDQGGEGVFVVSTSGSSAEMLEPGAWSPAWSPDGRSVAMMEDGALYESGSLVLVSGDPPQKRTLATHGGGPIHWSPDGSWIAFEVPGADVLDLGELWIVRPDGSGQRRLTDMSDRGRSAAWSPDGRSLAWSTFAPQGDGDPKSDIIVFDVATGTHARLPGGSGLSRGNPAWSPRGDRVAYTESGANADPYQAVIAIVDVRDASVSRITDPPEGLADSDPAWSPDGSRLLFIRRNEQGYGDIITVPAAGGDARFVVTGAYSAGWLK